MIVTLMQLKNRVRKFGVGYFRYMGRTSDGVYDFGIIDDCFNQITLHCAEEGSVIENIIGSQCEL